MSFTMTNRTFFLFDQLNGCRKHIRIVELNKSLIKSLLQGALGFALQLYSSQTWYNCLVRDSLDFVKLSVGDGQRENQGK